MKTKERGYFKIDTPEGVKYAHFSRTFLGQLKEVMDTDLGTLGKKLQSAESYEDQFDVLTDMLHAGLNAYALEEGDDITWNTYKVGNWLWEAMNESDEIGAELIAALNASLPKPGKK